MNRWKPTRAGIFNIWEYDDQIFEFGDGRLVLRGRNGSGKSNALSLIFPFVLDGVMSANRMDPMGGGRSMKSLLLGRDDDDASGGRYRYDSGSGYVWMEFERTDAADSDVPGEIEHLTIGVGAHATQQRDANAWFFVTPLRVGVDLDLFDDDVPKGRRQLTESLDGRGDVYVTAEDYRLAVDRVLFGLGAARQRTLLDLLLTLRRPHLAGKLDTDHLSFTLSSGLAELDAALIADVAHSFDDLDAMHDELEGVTGALATVERFLPVYRSHLLGVARGRSQRLVAVDAEQRDVARQLRTSRREHADAEADVADVTTLVTDNRRERERVDAEIEAIQTSQAFQDAAALAEAERSVSTARRAAESAEAARRESDAQHQRATHALATADAAVLRRRDDLDRTFADWRDLAMTAALHDVPGGATDFDEDRVVAAIVTRTAEVDDVDALAESAADASAAAQRAATARQRLHDDHVEAQRRQGDAEAEVERVVAELTADLARWVDHVDPIVTRARTFADRELPDTGSWAQLDVADAEFSAVLDAGVAQVRTALAVAGDRLGASAADRRRTIDSLLAERRRVADEPNPGPPPDPTRPDGVSPERVGAPLYACVDFAETVAPADRAGLEAALDAAGLLDARIAPTAAAIDDVLDARIAPTAAAIDDVLDARIDAIDATVATATGGLTLADVLVPIAVGDLDIDDISSALRAVPLDDGVVRIGRDGSWRLGPVAGRYRKDSAEYIGHEARERRRAARLAELDGLVDDERAVLADVESLLAALAGLADELGVVAASRPSAEPLLGAQRSLAQFEARTEQLADQLATATTEAEIADELAATTSAELHRRADALAVPVAADARRELVATIARCRTRTDSVVAALDRLDDALEQQRATADALGEAAGFLAAATQRASDASAQADDDQLRYDTLLARVGDDVQAAVQALEDAKRRLREARRSGAELSERLRGAQVEVATLAERCVQLDGRLMALGDEVAAAASSMVAVCSDEVADVLLVAGADSAADPLVAARAVLADPTVVPEDATNRMEREHRTVLLDGLRAGHDPSMPKLDGFDVVRVGTADGEVPLGTLARRLRDDRDRLGLLLSDREREIFETHLLARVGDALRELLYEADHFEQRINAEMAKAPTSSGMTVELSWGVDSDDPTVKQAVTTLRYSPDTLSAEQREVLRAFFTEQIQARRAADPGRSFVEVLTTALDYRSWHSFSFAIRAATGGKRQVTRKYFRELSGGEAATVLHLPLFAAAAAHYASGAIAGPRLIALDEAFAGIDDDMRGKLMGLLVQLDLDVLLTSHEFWGFYAQVPNLVLYDLTRSPSTPGVFAQRLEWSSTDAAR
jgi:uncharacterized protein (TIGR02680 family)